MRVGVGRRPCACRSGPAPVCSCQSVSEWVGTCVGVGRCLCAHVSLSEWVFVCVSVCVGVGRCLCRNMG
ncbi:hypothetical protein chiPu_0028369, partial [Chiloscyllium punctatum]|nr:hypothetical protein [Chiloscyllium punctatum]